MPLDGPFLVASAQANYSDVSQSFSGSVCPLGEGAHSLFLLLFFLNITLLLIIFSEGEITIGNQSLVPLTYND